MHFWFFGWEFSDSLDPLLLLQVAFCTIHRWPKLVVHYIYRTIKSIP